MQDTISQTAAFKLFKYKFTCTIPEEFIHDDNFRNAVGVYIGNDSKYATHPGQQVPAVKTIAELAEILHAGASVNISNVQDAVEIYTIITDHLQDCVDYKRGGLFGQLPPMEDLYKLDAFANKIYPMAKHSLKKRREKETPKGLIGQLMMVSRNGELDGEHVEHEDHESVMSQIDGRKIAGRRAWS